MDVARALTRALAPHRRIALDTSAFIYALEAHPHLGSASTGILEAVMRGQVTAAASTLVVAELLVVPYRQGAREVAAQYVAQLERYPHLELVAPSVEICRTAAEWRAGASTLRLPDALHLATAACVGATAFITNDHRIAAVLASLGAFTALTVVLIDTLVEPQAPSDGAAPPQPSSNEDTAGPRREPS